MTPSRRTFLSTLGAATGAAAVGALPLPGLAAETESKPPRGSAEHCIFLWLGGGASQIDTWDPKGRGDSKTRKAGSDYAAVDTAIPGEKVCEHLSRTAPLLDRCAVLRTVFHDVVDEHAAAVNRMHTGRATADTIVYPSVGSIAARELGAAAEGVPAYVVMGYPNVTRGPGFLGPKHGYVYLLDTKSGPNGLVPPPGITPERRQRRQATLERLRSMSQRYADPAGREKVARLAGRLEEAYAADEANDRAIREYAAMQAEGFRLGGKDFMSAFDLASEPSGLRESYGSEFGQRCLLARRLVQRGVRFVEVSHNLNFMNGTGWDTHNEGHAKQHELIDELDRAFSTLLTDLGHNRLLDKTLIVISTEFGRPGGFDGRGGRGHQCSAFSVVLAGGGLRTGKVIGRTDDLSARPVERPVSVPDLFATTFAALGINPQKNLLAGDRPVPITDGGTPVTELFS